MTVTELIGHLQALELCGSGNDKIKMVEEFSYREYKPESMEYNADKDVVLIKLTSF